MFKPDKHAGYDRNLDFAIARALGWTIGSPHYVKSPDGTPHGVLPNWTSSIDAAMTLVPSDHQIDNWFIGSDQSSCLDVCEPAPDKGFRVVNRHNGEGNTPALALCIAALRALSASKVQRGRRMTNQPPESGER